MAPARAPARFVFVFEFVVVDTGAPAPLLVVVVPRAKYFGSRFRAAKSGWSARRGGASGRVLVIVYRRAGVGGIMRGACFEGAVAVCERRGLGRSVGGWG